MSDPRLSKARYLSGTQCHLRLWYETHRLDLTSEPDDVLQAVFDTGHEVGRTARGLYPGGHAVSHDHRRISEALDETRSVVEAGSTPALFEATFEHEGVLVRADVIERLPEGGWRLVEVKSSTRLKDVFVLDAAVQLWVLKGAGLDVRDAGVLTLDRDYVYDGVTLDVDALFSLHPVFDEAHELLGSVATQVAELQAMLSESAAPDVAPGDHCFEPYACPYYAHCTAGCGSTGSRHRRATPTCCGAPGGAGSRRDRGDSRRSRGLSPDRASEHRPSDNSRRPPGDARRHR